MALVRESDAGTLREGRWVGRGLCFGRKGTGHVRNLHSSCPDLGGDYTSVPVVLKIKSIFKSTSVKAT